MMLKLGFLNNILQSHHPRPSEMHCFHVKVRKSKWNMMGNMFAHRFSNAQSIEGTNSLSQPIDNFENDFTHTTNVNRWFNLYLDDLKCPINRVPRDKIRPIQHEDTTSKLMSRLKPTHKPRHTYDASQRRIGTFRLEAYRSDKAAAIKAAVARVMARRRGDGKASELIDEFIPRKGQEVRRRSSFFFYISSSLSHTINVK